jgi:hypothetical protein
MELHTEVMGDGSYRCENSGTICWKLLLTLPIAKGGGSSQHFYYAAENSPSPLESVVKDTVSPLFDKEGLGEI